MRSKLTVPRTLLAVVLLAAAVVLGVPSADASTYSVPASIDGTGARDVTQELNDFIASVPDGSTISFPSDATYRVEGVVAIDGREGLSLRFNGSRLVADTDGSGVTPYAPLRARWPRHRTHLYIRDSFRIRVHDLGVRGANDAGGRADEAYRPELEAQHAVEIAGSRNVRIEGCSLSKTYGDGVYIGNDSEKVVVRRCTIHNTGRQGIAVTGARHVFLQRNHLYEIRRTAFDLEPGGPIQHVRIQDNRVGYARGNFVSGHGQGSVFTDIAIVDNELYGEMQIHMKAPPGMRRGSVIVQGNRSEKRFGSPQALFTFIRYDDVLVVGNQNTFDGRRGGVGVLVDQACRAYIEGNEFIDVETEQVVVPAEGCAPHSLEPTSWWMVLVWLQAREADGLPPIPA